MELTVSFKTLPLWVRHKQAGNLVKSSRLKELRESRQITFKTIDGNICYLLKDLLAQAGVEEVLFYADVDTTEATEDMGEKLAPSMEMVEVEPPHEHLAVEEQESFKVLKEGEFLKAPEPAPQPVEAEEVVIQSRPEVPTPRRTQFYCDLFTYKSNIIPENIAVPVFRQKNSKDCRFSGFMGGKPVDIQAYKASYNGDVYNKIRVIIQHNTMPDRFYILQLRTDKFYLNILANMIAELLMNTEIPEINIQTSIDNGDKTAFDVYNDDDNHEFRPSTGFHEKHPDNALLEKIKLAQSNIQQKGWFMDVCPISNDKTFVESV